MVKERQILGVAISVCLGWTEHMGMKMKTIKLIKERNMGERARMGVVLKTEKWMPKNLQKRCEKRGRRRRGDK